jgi:hypothetical protein
VKEPEQSVITPPIVVQPEEPEKVKEEVIYPQEQPSEVPVTKRRGRPKKSDQSDDGMEKEKKPKKKKHKRKKRKVKGVKEDVKDSVEVQTRKEEDEDVQDET